MIYTMQYTFPFGIPPVCDDIQTSAAVKWFKFEGKGGKATVKVESDNLYTTITVTRGDENGECHELDCVGATVSLFGAASGDTSLTVETKYHEIYYVAVTTIGGGASQSGPITVNIED